MYFALRVDGHNEQRVPGSYSYVQSIHYVPPICQQICSIDLVSQVEERKVVCAAYRAQLEPQNSPTDGKIGLLVVCMLAVAAIIIIVEGLRTDSVMCCVTFDTFFPGSNNIIIINNNDRMG